MANQGLMKALTELTSLEAPTDSFVTLNAADPLLMKYPVAYVSEPAAGVPRTLKSGRCEHICARAAS